ncbi:hypothetical protein, partial [Candidatus Thiodiazotropha endoloripes]|uniref:hypothetical protein n=1 Tax=Candidatus Thiodiazotropha endoloripes TaxID=1818881 RepID=UPI001F22A440
IHNWSDFSGFSGQIKTANVFSLGGICTCRCCTHLTSLLARTDHLNRKGLTSLLLLTTQIKCITQ